MLSLTVLLCCCAFTSMLAAKHVAVCKDVSEYISQHQGVLLNFTGLTNMVYLVIAHRKICVHLIFHHLSSHWTIAQSLISCNGSCVYYILKYFTRQITFQERSDYPYNSVSLPSCRKAEILKSSKFQEVLVVKEPSFDSWWSNDGVEGPRNCIPDSSPGALAPQWWTSLPLSQVASLQVNEAIM